MTNLTRELTVRCIAHNLSERYPVGGGEPRDAVIEYAIRIADVCGYMPGEARQIAVAAVALWEGMMLPSDNVVRIDSARLDGLQSEENRVVD